jgi:hypothetical protein
MKEFVLAEALLRRKELQQKVDHLQKINKDDFFQVQARRVKVTDSIDDLTVAVPKLTASQFTEELDWHARQLRLVDGAIQRANWTAKVELPAEAMEAYKARPIQEYTSKIL